MKRLLFTILAASLAFATSVTAETTVKLSGVHLCCDSCVKGVAGAVKKVEGASVACDKAAGTVTVTAGDDATAKKALASIARAGYYGKSDNAKLQVPGGRGKDAKVTDQKVAGVHLCCGKCVKAVDKAVAAVPGATGHDAEKGSKVFTVKGTYSAAALQAALHDVGLSGRAPGGKGKGKGGKGKKKN